MNRRFFILSMFACMLFVLPANVRGEDRSLEELKQRFKERHRALMELKDNGRIGETWLGYVAAVNDSNSEDKKIAALIKKENDDRILLYEKIAKKENIEPVAVAGRNALRQWRKAKPGHYFKHKEQGWQRKK